jgi:hypothetical protein
MSLSRLTHRSRLDRDLHGLEGILKGIAIDGDINPDEIAALQRWCEIHADVAATSPFDEVLPMLEESIADGVLDDDERADLLWFINQCSTPNSFYNEVTSDLQRLHGVMAGIGADGKVHDAEVHALSDWLETVSSLRGNWPYDEIDTFVTHILADGVVDEQERKLLLGFCSEFASKHVDLLIEGATPDFVRHGVCATTPEIEFAGKTFCLTGASQRAKRGDIEKTIAALGGKPHPRVVPELSYLIICADGSRHWAFSCYGRKVEQTMKLRKEKQARIVIAHEYDLWDAVEDHGGKRP